MDLPHDVIESWADQVAEAEVRRVEAILDQGVLYGEDYRAALDQIRRRFRRLTTTQRDRVVALIGEPE